jgi:DNA-directed RNA polymerase specialized sigma24 family protein
MPSATVGTLRTVLEADVSQFNASFAQASRTTKQWAKDFDLAGKSAKEVGTAFTQSLERSLSNTIRLAKEFSGAGIAKTADEMAAAVERIGGPLRLTATEQARVNSTVTEAIAKYKALGADAPAHLLKLADATKQVAATTASSLGGLSDIWGKVQQGAGLLGIGLGASAVVKFATDTVASASAVHDLAEKLGVSTTKVQQWSYALVQTGGSQDNLNISLAFLNKTLGEGNKGTNDLLASMGLSLKTLREQKPEQTFEQLVEKIGAMTDPLQQAKAAVMLFGKSGQDMLPAIKEGFLDIARAAPVMSEAAINALERAGDEWDKFLARIKAQAGTFLGTIAAAQNRAADVMRIVNADTARARAGGGVSGRSFQDISAYSDSRLAAELAVLDALEKADKKYADAHKATGAAVAETTKQFEYATAAQLKAVKPMTTYVGELTDAKKAVHDLTAENRAELDAGILMGKSQTELSQKVGISEEAVKLYTEAHQKAVEAAKAHKEALDNLSASAAQLPKQVQEHILQLVAQGKSEHDIALVLGVHEQQVKDIVSIYHDWQQATKDQTTAQDGLDKALQHLNDTNAKQARADIAAFNKSQQDQADATAHNEVQGLVAIDRLNRDTQARNIKGTREEYDIKKKAIQDWGAQQKTAFTGSAKDAAAYGKAIDDNVTAQIRDLGKTTTEEIVGAFAAFPAELARAFSSGGLGAAVSSAFGQLATRIGTNFSQQIASSLGADLAKGTGSAIGLMVGGLTTAGIGLGVSMFTGAMDTQEQKRKLEQAIVAAGGRPDEKYKLPAGVTDLHGPYDNMMQQLKDLTAANEALKKSQDDVTAAAQDQLRQLNLLSRGLFDNFDKDMEIAQKHGIAVEDLGKKFQQAQISSTGEGLGSDFQQLLKDGAAGGDLLRKFTPELQALVAQAEQFGVSLPAAIKDQIGSLVGLSQEAAKAYEAALSSGDQAAIDEARQKFIAAGGLFDKEGHAITDISQLKFLADQQAAVLDATAATKASTTAMQELTAATKALAASFGNPHGDVRQAPLMDVPLMSVTAPGVVRVTPGDWVGKPGMTPGFGNFNMDRPISLTIPVHVGGRLVDNYVVETTLRKLEQNDSGGANLSYRTRLNRVIG